MMHEVKQTRNPRVHWSRLVRWAVRLSILIATPICYGSAKGGTEGNANSNTHC